MIMRKADVSNPASTDGHPGELVTPALRLDIPPHRNDRTLAVTMAHSPHRTFTVTMAHSLHRTFTVKVTLTASHPHCGNGTLTASHPHCDNGTLTAPAHRCACCTRTSDVALITPVMCGRRTNYTGDVRTSR
jgi:hypothetical protein